MSVTSVTFSITPLEEKSNSKSVVTKVTDELYSQGCENSIKNSQELKQWICKWQLILQTILRKACVDNVLLLHNIEIVHTCKINYVYEHSEQFLKNICLYST